MEIPPVSRRTLLRGTVAAGAAIGIGGLLARTPAGAAAPAAPAPLASAAPPDSTTDPAGLTVTPRQPVMHGYLSRDLATWSPATDPYARYSRSRVPLAPRIPVFVATQAKPALAHGPQVLDLSDDYYGKFGYRSLRYQNDMSLRTSRFWQYQDIYAAWHGLITADSPLTATGATYGVVNLPNPAWTDAAHRNGVRSLGCWFWPRGDTFANLVVSAPDGSYPVADKLLAMAAYFGFDGYFVNQEGNVAAADATRLMAMLKYLRAKAPAGFHVQWYDAMLPGGSVSYQNQFNSANAPWVLNAGTPVCHSMFLNYAWNTTRLSSSRSYAQSLGLDPYATVFAGSEIQQRGFVNSLDYDPRQNFPDGGPARTSWALFGTTSISAPPGVDLTNPATQQTRYAMERRFWSGPNSDPTATGRLRAPTQADLNAPYDAYQVWDGVAHYIVERSAIGAFPFVTRFNTGKGAAFHRRGVRVGSVPWAHAGVADILPTWQWWVRAAGSGAKLTVDYDATTAWDGGTSLKVSGTLQAGDSNDIRLFKTRLPASSATTARIVYNAGGAGSDLGLSLGLVFEDSPTQTTWVPVAGAYAAGWNTAAVQLGGHAGRTIAAVSLRFTAARQTSYAVNVGELALLDGPAVTPAAPTGFRLDASHFYGTSAELLLSWTFGAPGVWHYDLRRVRPDGSLEAIGRVYDEVFYVNDLQRVAAEATSTLQLVPVSVTGDEGPAATAVLTWGSGPSVNLALNAPATGTTPANSAETPAKAVNGSVGGGNSDKFCSLTTPSWLRVDLGSVRQVDQFVVRHASAGGETASYNTRTFTIELSTDGGTWTTAVTVANNTAAVTTHPITATPARYVRLNVTTPTQTSDKATRIYELEVYGT